MPSSPPPRAAARDALIDNVARRDTALDESASSSLETIYRTEANGLTSYFRRRLRRSETPADYVQESFARLAAIMVRQPILQPRRYLRIIARNLLFEQTRRLKSRPTMDHVALSEFIEPSVPPDQMHRLEAKDLLETYRRAVSELPEKTRIAFLLHRVDELTYKEISKQLEISIPTVQYHMTRALAYLDAALEKE